MNHHIFKFKAAFFKQQLKRKLVDRPPRVAQTTPAICLPVRCLSLSKGSRCPRASPLVNNRVRVVFLFTRGSLQTEFGSYFFRFLNFFFLSQTFFLFNKNFNRRRRPSNGNADESVRIYIFDIDIKSLSRNLFRKRNFDVTCLFETLIRH